MEENKNANPNNAAPQAPAAPAAPTAVVVAAPEDSFWSDSLKVAGRYAMIAGGICGGIVLVSLAAEGIRRLAGWGDVDSNNVGNA